MATFDILGARDAGIPDEEIATFLATRVPKFDIAGAREAGVDETAIVDFLLPKVNVKPEGVLSSIGSGAIAGLREVAGVVAPAYNAVFGLSGKELETLQRTDPTFAPEKSAVQYSPGTIAEKFAAGGESKGPFSYVGDVAQQLVDAAFYHLPAGVASAIQGPEGRDYAKEPDWKDALIARADALAKERNARTDIPDAVKSLGPSAGASLVSMIGGISAGVGTTTGLAATGVGAVAAPVAGWTAGVAASGALAYRMSANQFARQLYDAANANALDRTGAPISPEEWAAKRDELAPLIAEYGLWEAVPEALSQGLGLKIISVPIKAGITSIFGKSVLTRLTTKTAAVLGTELATETITQQGQRNVEVEATGQGTPRSWTSAADLGDSFTDVAAATILQTAIMGGGTKLALNLRDRVKRGGLTREQFDAVQELNDMVENAQIDPEGAREAAVRLLDPNAYDPNLIRLRDYPADREATPVGAMSTTKEMVHAAADRAGMPWDNDPAFMDLTERLTGKRELDKLTPRELTAVKEAIEEVAPPPTIAPVAPRPTAAAIEATLAKNKAVLLTGSEGLAPVVERVVNENETVEDFAAAANLAVGTGPNSVANFIAQGYAEIPGVSEYYTRLTKTNADKTVRTVDVSSNGDVENDTTLLGNYTVNGTPISIRFNNRQKILQSIEEDGTVMDSSEKATRSYIGGVPLLDILRAEDVNATVAPVTETVAPAVTEVAAPVTETVAPAETEAAIEQNRDRRNPASVLQMQQIANAPDYLRARVGNSLANDAPIVAGGAIPAEQRGRVDDAVDSEGNRTKIQFAVVDASTVLTSNTVDGAVNPDYAGSSELRAIAGNGRITGFREAYARGTADNYRAEFEADTLHGIDPEVVRSVPNPILVRVMSEADITSDMGDRTNTATQLGMNPEETARNDANRVDLNTLDFRENGDPTAEATRAFLRGMPDNERATLLDGQVPTADATMRLKRAIFFKAYNDPGLMSQLTTIEDGRTVISVLTQLAPVMSRLDQAGDLDIRNIVVDAAKIVIKAGKEGIPLSEAARQSDLTVKSDANLVVALMAEKPGGVKNTVEVLRSVANFAYAEATKPETDMFGVTPRATRADVVAKLRAALSPAGAQLVMPGTEAVAPPPSLAVELARLEGRQTKMGRTGQEAPGGIFTAAEAAKQGELALPQNILDLAEKWFNAYQNTIDNTEYTPEGEGRVAGKYKAASTMTFRRLSTALKKIEPNAAKRLEILQDLFRKNGAKVAASQAAPAVEPGLKSVGVGANGQSVAAVRAQMVPLKGITVEVVQSASELPETAAPSMAEGAWYSGTTVYLVADNLPNARRVQEVLAHEAIGHAALETMLGPQLMAELLTNVQTLERLGGRQIQAIAAYVDQRQPGLAPTDRAKEIIAVMAERGEYTNSSVWRRAIEAVRSWLRTQGFTIAFSNQDVLAMLRDAEKFANRAPETTAATGGRYSVAEGETSVTRSKPDINKKRMVKLLGPQLYGDMRDIAQVTVKELFQNSFDAVKGALERGDISLGHISITTDRAARTITIVDDGGGMAVDTINKAFLTMAGTEKDTERASGGLGIAKMLFLLGNKALSLETVRSGRVSRMTTSGSQITETLDNPDLAPLIETRSTTAAPGTTVVVTIPETYMDNDTNEVTDIFFPSANFLSGLIDSSPLLANIEVKLNDSVRPIGANYDLNGATVLTEVKFPWGTARLLVRPNKNPARQNLNVLSEGLNQFGLNITKDPGDPFSRAVPYDFLLNLEPTVKADSPRYPIALNRQGFSASAKSDMGALIDYVNVLYANKTDQDSAKTFGALELLERVPGGYQIKNVSLQIPDAAVGTVLSINPTDNVKVVDGRVIVNNRPMPPLTKDNVKAMRRNPQQFRVDQSLIDKDAVIFHDNVLTDGKPLLAEARAALGAGPVNEYLNGLGGIIQDLRAATARVGGANYASVTDIPTGLSFDTTYYGVNTTIPFKAIMLNPMVVRDPATGYAMTPNTLSRAERASTFVGTIVHELVHHAEKNHSETGFIPELARVSVQLAVSGDLAIAVQNVNQLLQRYDAVAEYFMEKNANGNITARGVRLAGNAERTGPGVSERPTGASGTGRNGENAVREGVGRGDTAGTGSQERGGPAAEGGEGVAVGDERYSVKSETRPGSTVAQVKSSIANAAGALRIKTNVYATVAEARAATGVDIPADALGMYSKNELHFIAENISSGLNAEIALWHEVTHAGLDRLYGFGSAQYNAALTTIALRNPEIQREAAKWRAEFGADILQRAQDRGVTAERADQYVRMRAIDEALSVMSSQNVTIRGLDKFIAAVQKILRQVGLTNLADAMEGKTNAEALALISKARGAVLADGSYVVTDSVPAFSRGAGFMGNRTEPTLPVPETKTEKRLDSAVYNYVDRFVDLKNLMKTIKTQAAALPEALDAYSMVERLTSKVAKRLEDFGLREIGPLMTEMKARGVTVVSLDRYLWMRGAEDANRIIAAQPDTKFPNFDGAGVSTTDAQAYLAALTPAQRTAFEALARRVYAITAKTRREWVNSGLATLDDVLTMEREQPYYVPFNREGKDTVAGTGQGVSVRGPNTYHRKGSDLPVVDVLANIIHQRERAVTRGQKNLIARAIYTLAKAFPAADTWSLAKPGLTSAIDAETGEPVNILDMSYQKDDNVLMSIRLDKDGKMVSQGVAFNEENPQAMRMVGALKNLDLPSLQGLLGGTALVTRYFAALNTQYNPIFGIINFLRDVPTGQLNLSTTPIAGKQGAVFLRVGPSLAAIYKGARARRGGLSPVATEYDNYFERLRNAGGTSGWRQSYETSADRGKALQKELESLSSGVANKILPAIGGWLSDYNTAMENSVRLAAFITAVESGMSDAQAASLAKNLTVNFDRKGARSSQIGALFAFFNPSVQGTVRTFETLSGPAGKKIIAGGLLLGAVQAVILAMAGFDDDDPPEFVRQRNVIIPIGDKKYVSFPMPLGFNIIPNIGRLAMQTVLRPQNIGKNVFSVLDATLSTFNPFGSGVSLQTITPTALDPLVAIATNTDWTGRPIEREDFSSLDPTPGFTRAKDNATAVNKVIAEAINTLTGGNKYTPGKWSPTPDLLDYVAGQLTGGPGRELIHLESSVEGWLTGKEVPTYKVPLVGRFYGNVGSEASDKARYYENVKKINELENNVKGMQKDRVSANEYRQDNPQARLIPAANVIKRQISQFRAQKDKPNNDDVKTDALILRQMQRLNALVAPYNAPTEQQKFLRGSVAE